MKLEIRQDSSNYTAQIVRLPPIQDVKGLDNLGRVSIFGSDCLITKTSNPDELYVFFPAECQLSKEFLSINCLYRHSELNEDPEKKGFFEDNGRVKSLKFKGVISTCFVIPVQSLFVVTGETNFKVGQEFTTINGIEICQKYIKKFNKSDRTKEPRLLDELVDSRMAPEHPDTAQLFRNLDKLKLGDYVAVTYKIHGTSARFYHTLTKRQLPWYEHIAKWFGIKIVEEDYNYVCASRRVVKSLNFQTLDNKQHFYSTDIWSEVGRNHFKDRLNKGEAVYCEIIGSDYEGKAIQHGYTYGYQVPKVYIYRISNISPQGIEIDLPYLQMKERAAQIGVDVCPELFYGTLSDFITTCGVFYGADDRDVYKALDEIFYGTLLEKPSILDSLCLEEGFTVRRESFPRPTILKVKSRGFLLQESKNLDKDIVDIEEQS